MSFNDDQLKALSAPLHLAHVKSRAQAGRNLSYIEAWHAISEANRIFGFDGWTRETVELRQLGEPRLVDGKYRVGYAAKVRITVTAGERAITREGCGFGSGIDKDPDQAHESALKEAESDAMKRALMTFGNPFGLALYDKTQANVSSFAPENDPPQSGETRTVPPPPSKAELKRSGIFQTLHDEIKACATVDELLAWDKRREPDIKALPKDWYEALGDRFLGRREELENPPPPEAAEMDEAFRATMGPPSAGAVANGDGQRHTAAA